ncbi:MAG TPA: hypothetical protein DIT29_02740 [Pseudothermotoga sp.]|nr:hypothetical protein [Pseudothermotoga sp.]HCO97627.1 hypothetical protein [Pseudothermotoga sp.]
MLIEIIDRTPECLLTEAIVCESQEGKRLRDSSSRASYKDRPARNWFYCFLSGRVQTPSSFKALPDRDCLEC